MTPQETVAALVERMERKDLDAALELLADDVEYDNVPMGKVHGRDAVRAALAPFLERCRGVEWQVLHTAATGDVVMNERVDRFEMPWGWVGIAVAGLFVVRDGEISLWRDYFDLAAATAMMTPPT